MCLASNSANFKVFIKNILPMSSGWNTIINYQLRNNSLSSHFSKRNILANLSIPIAIPLQIKQNYPTFPFSSSLSTHLIHYAQKFPLGQYHQHGPKQPMQDCYSIIVPIKPSKLLKTQCILSQLMVLIKIINSKIGSDLHLLQELSFQASNNYFLWNIWVSLLGLEYKMLAFNGSCLFPLQLLLVNSFIIRFFFYLIKFYFLADFFNFFGFFFKYLIKLIV